MTPLQLTLILHIITTYLGSSSLPITSKPLDDSPDHLTWEAWLMVDSKNPYEQQGKVRKIPKSIFIAPNRGNESNVVCDPGYKMGPKGQCVKVVIINESDLLESQIQSVFGSTHTTKEEDYDYEYEDADTSTNSEPFHVNIPLNIDDNDDDSKEVYGPISDKVYNVGAQDVATTTASPATTSSPTTTTIITSSSSFHHPTTTTTTTTTTTSATSNKNLFDNVFAGADPYAMAASQTIASTTSDTNINTNKATDTTATTTTPSSTVVSSSIASVTSTTAVPIDADSVIVNLEQVTNNSNPIPSHVSYPMEIKPINNNTTDNKDGDQVDEEENEMDTEKDDNYTTTDEFKHDDLANKLTKTEEEASALKAALESESLIESDTTVNTNYFQDMEGTTDLPDESITTLPSINDDIVKVSDKIEDVLYNLKIDESQTTIATPSVFDKTLLKVDKESDVNKRNRESLIQHEFKQSVLENIDTNNRFVYHHLGNPHIVATTERSPLETTTIDILEQLKAINRQTLQNRRSQEERYRFRFPDHWADQDTNRRTDDLIRFPGPTVTHPLTHRNNVHVVDQLAKRPLSTDERPPLWWLPTGWEVDRTGPKPMLLRFWSRSQNNVPELASGRQAPGSATTSSLLGSERANSRRPTENLYKDMTSSDVYKVFHSRSGERDS